MVLLLLEVLIYAHVMIRLKLGPEGSNPDIDEWLGGPRAKHMYEDGPSSVPGVLFMSAQLALKGISWCSPQTGAVEKSRRRSFRRSFSVLTLSFFSS